MTLKRNEKQITLNDLNEIFLPSGTHVFGGSTVNSDYDFLVHPSKMRDAWRILSKYETSRDMYYDKDVYSYYFFLESGEKVNLIIFRNKELYFAWRYATERMVQIKHSFVNRKERHRIFQAFVKFFLDDM